jgi:hypothetical protein
MEPALTIRGGLVVSAGSKNNIIVNMSWAGKNVLSRQQFPATRVTGEKECKIKKGVQR